MPSIAPTLLLIVAVACSLFVLNVYAQSPTQKPTYVPTRRPTAGRFPVHIYNFIYKIFALLGSYFLYELRVSYFLCFLYCCIVL